MRGGLPVDLLQDIARRLQILCGIVPVVATTGAIATRVTGTGGAPSPFLFDGVLLFWVASLTILIVIRRGRLPAQRLLDVGMVYGIVVAGIAALVTVPLNWLVTPRQSLLWSPVAVWVLIFPMIVPNTTKRTLIAALLAAAMEPLALLLYVRLGQGSFPPGPVFARAMWGNLTAVGIAVIASRVLYRLGEKLTQARALGSYQLEGLLGEGGMGQVFRGRHRLLARPSAIKIITPSRIGVDSRDDVERIFRRFEREAQTTALLESPHTIEVYDFGLGRDGTFYYVMELLDGLDLYELVNRYGPQPPERVVWLVRQACHSLYEAHERGLVHRDIKPGNLFTCRVGMDVDILKVLDFGLVLPRERSGSGLSAENEAIPVGTPMYMAPEAIMAGPDMPVDHSIDLYALGCSAYWLLSGRNVFEKANQAALMMAHLKEPPRPVSEVAPQPVPAGLEAAVMACLAKLPEDRPRTARELSDRLQALDLEREWTPERRNAWWALHDSRKPAAQPAG